MIARVLRSSDQAQIGIDRCCLVSKFEKQVSNVSQPAGDNCTPYNTAGFAARIVPNGSTVARLVDALAILAD